MAVRDGTTNNSAPSDVVPDDATERGGPGTGPLVIMNFELGMDTFRAVCDEL